MSPDEYMYNYVATAPEICGMRTYNVDGSLYAITTAQYSFGELLQMGVDLLFSGAIEKYVIWCEFGSMI